jgi:hypothetical protein
MTVSVSDRVPLEPVTYESWSEVNALRIVVVIDGLRYSVVDAQWTENGHGAGDSASIVVPLSTNPDFPVQLFRGQAVNDSGLSNAQGVIDLVNATEGAAQQADVVVELWLGFPQNPTVDPTSIEQLDRWFLGEVDLYKGVFQDNTVTFSCRSLAAHLLDDHITAVSMNQTVGAFLAQQATRLGLPAPVVKPLPGNKPATIQEVLQYDQVGGQQFSAALYGMHPMDLAIRGAQVDDTDVWVNVRTGTIRRGAHRQHCGANGSEEALCHRRRARAWGTTTSSLRNCSRSAR